MIAVSNECYKALLAEPVRLRPKAIWKIGGTTAGGIDISERITEWPTPTQLVPAFLGNASIADAFFTLSNTDGRFTTRRSDGYLPDGPFSYYGTEIAISQEVLLPSGAIESIPVFAGVVQYITPGDGTVEIKVAGRSALLLQTLTREEIALESTNSSGINGSLSAALTAIFAQTSFVYTDWVNTTGQFFTQMNTNLQRAGWLLAGGVAARAVIGAAVQELARCCLGTAIDGEDGKIQFVPMCLPREMSGIPLAGINLPDIFDERRAFAFGLSEGVQTYTTEIGVRYAGGAVATYRDTVAEALRPGSRVFPPISMEFLRLGAHASWAARMVYEFHKAFPITFGFIAPAIGLVAQIGDICQLRDTVTDTIREAVVVGKAWQNPGLVSLVVRTNSARDSIFEANQAIYGTDSWGAVLL